MKVLTLISGGDTGGAKTHVLSLLRELSRIMDVQLVCFMKGDFSKEAAAMGIPTEVIEGNPLSALPKLRRLAAAFRCDIIHCHGSRGNFMGMLLQKTVKAPLLTTVHSDYKLDYLGRPLRAAVYGTLNAIALRNMDFMTGVSDSMSSLLIRRGFDPANIFTIYNGIEFDRAVQDFDRIAWLRSLGLDIPEDALVAGIAARLDPVKDIPTLLQAFAKAHARVPKLHLLIAGDGQKKEALQKLAISLGVEKQVHFLGWLDNTDDFYRALDINTLTSRSETFPYALTEGAKFFLPTVSSRVGGVPQLIDHGVSGLLFEPGDWETLAEQLVTLALDADLRRTLGQSLGQKARSAFSLEASCRRQLEIYETVLRRYARRDELKKHGIMICGAYGHGNAGDEAILEAIVTEMRTLDADLPITVLSRTPKETAVRCGVRAKHSFALLGILPAMRRTKLFLCGGGTLMQDATSSRSLWYYLFMLAAAKRRGCRVLMYGCGIGPLNTAFDRRLAQKRSTAMWTRSRCANQAACVNWRLWASRSRSLRSRPTRHFRCRARARRRRTLRCARTVFPRRGDMQPSACGSGRALTGKSRPLRPPRATPGRRTASRPFSSPSTTEATAPPPKRSARCSGMCPMFCCTSRCRRA